MAVVLYHATPWWNLESIFELGLLPDRARGERKCVYLHTLTRVEWAIVHVARRHHCETEDIRIVKVELPRCRLRSLTYGLSYCLSTIHPNRISRDLTRQLRQEVAG